MLRTLIADDEPLARKRLRALLSTEPDFKVTAEADNGIAALEAITSETIDVAFLDIQMPTLDGFGILDSIGSQGLPHIVFVTAFQEHAVRAFEVDAVDYLVKPFENERFHRTLQKLRGVAPERSRQDAPAAVRTDAPGRPRAAAPSR